MVAREKDIIEIVMRPGSRLQTRLPYFILVTSHMLYLTVITIFDKKALAILYIALRVVFQTSSLASSSF